MKGIVLFISFLAFCFSPSALAEDCVKSDYKLSQSLKSLADQGSEASIDANNDASPCTVRVCRTVLGGILYTGEQLPNQVHCSEVSGETKGGICQMREKEATDAPEPDSNIPSVKLQSKQFKSQSFNFSFLGAISVMAASFFVPYFMTSTPAAPTQIYNPMYPFLPY